MSMTRNIIEIPRGSTAEARKIDKLHVTENTLIKTSGLQIGELTIVQPADFAGRDNFLCELRGNDCQIGRITIIGNASDSGTKEQWNAQVASGLHVTGNDNVIGQSFNERVHIPYLSTGTGNKLARLYAELASGDGFNLCNHGNELYLADFVSMITTFPYKIYHPDIGMMYHKDGLTLQDCNAYNVNYHLTGHRWEDPERQGFLSDNKTLNCGIINFVLPGVHPEHGCSWADAINCTTMNLVTNGAVSFDRKSKITIASAARENNYV